MESETHVPENPLNDPSNAAAQAAGAENPHEKNRLKRFIDWKEEQEANLKKPSISKKTTNSKITSEK